MLIKIFDNNTTSNDNLVKKQLYNNKYNIFFVNNVIKYNIEHFNTWNINTNIYNNNDSNNYYLIIDTTIDDAFGHWVFESAIYLQLFIELKKTYPNIKIHLKRPKKYKKIFIEYFNINTNDIVYNLEPINTCIFPLPISCLNIQENNNLFKEYIDDLFTYFNYTLEKKYNILLTPRGKLENLQSNDRNVNTIDIEHNISDISNNVIMYTDLLENLDTQIKLIKGSKNIIVTDGSPFLVNGMFSKNSTIFVLGDIVNLQLIEFKKMEYIYNKICENNEVIVIQRTNNFTYCYKDIKHFLIK